MTPEAQRAQTQGAASASAQLSGPYHSGMGPHTFSTSGTKLRSRSRTSAARFSTICCQRWASPIGYLVAE